MPLGLVSAGESHGPALVAIVTGLPAGLTLDRAAIDADLRRRQQGYGRSPRQSIETDEVEVLVRPHPGMQVVDLAYNADGSETALVAAARAAGCETVVDGLDVLLAQGAASFERWTGKAAPLAAMADALRRP